MRAVAVRLVGAGCCALVSGGLFRAAASTGQGAFRMAATLLLVATGLLLASATERWQLQEALKALERALAALPSAVTVLRLPAGAARRMGWEGGYVLAGPGGAMVLAALPISQAAWGTLARRTLKARAGSIRLAVQQLRRQALAGAGSPDGGGNGRSPQPFYGVALLLRRRCGRAEREVLEGERIGAYNIEHLGAVAKVLEAAPVPAAEGIQSHPAPRIAGSVARAAACLWGAGPLNGPAVAVGRDAWEGEG